MQRVAETGRTRLAEARDTFGRRSEALFADRWSHAELDTLAELVGRLVSGDVLQPGGEAA